MTQKPEPQTWAPDLRELRQRHSIKQKDLAAHLHISPSKLAKVEKGQLELTLKQADMFAERLGLSIDQVNLAARMTRERYHPPDQRKAA